MTPAALRLTGRLSVAAWLAAASSALGAGSPGPATADAGAKAPKIVWGAPADGVELGLSVSHERIAYGQGFTITFHVRNASKQAIRLIALDTAHSTAFGHYHEFLLSYRRADEQVWHTCRFCPQVGQGPKIDTLVPGQTGAVRFSADEQRGWIERYDSKVYVATWPPMPGRYVVRAMFGANGDMVKARAEKLWTSRAASGQVELVVPMPAFLERLKDDPQVTQAAIDEIYLSALGPSPPGAAAEKLIRIGDRKACLALLTLLRDCWCPGAGIEFLAERLGDQIAYDLARASGGSWADQTCAAGRALGRIGTAKAIAAVRELLKDPLWPGREGFVAGLGQSTTPESLALLAGLAADGSAQAAEALGKRTDDKAPGALAAVMTKGKPPACDHAARILAGRGDAAAVKWLAGHWDWLNAAAFVAAPIRWPTPPKEALAQDKALAIALRALPTLKDPQARYLDGKWYVLVVRGHPQVRGEFAYVILDAASGKVLARNQMRVLR